MTSWNNEKRFTSWLSLCPGTRTSNRKVLSSKTRRNSNRAAVNVQTRRIAIINYHIHWLIWSVLFGVTILSMIKVGYLFGRSGSHNWLFIIALSLAFSGVMILIVDLDRTGTRAIGAISVSQQPMIDLHERLYLTPTQVGSQR